MSISFKIIFWGIVSEILYLSIYTWYLFPQGIRAENGFFNRILIFILIVLTIIYVKQYGHILKVKKFSQVIFFALLFNVTLFFSKPIASIDLDTYIYQARIYSKYHQNPYIVPYSNFKNDLFYAELNNFYSEKPAVYGSFFLLLATVLTFLGGDNLSLNIYLFKLVFVFLNLASGYLTYKITKSKGAYFLYSWNPLLIFEFALNAHIDIVAVFFTLASIYFLFKNKNLSGFLISLFLLILAGLTKFFSFLLAPFFVIFILKKLNPLKSKVLFLFCVGILSSLMIFLSYLPFWDGLAIFRRLGEALFAIKSIPSLGILIFSLFMFLLKVKDPLTKGRELSRALFLGIYLYFLTWVFFSKKFTKEKFLYSISIITVSFFATFFMWYYPWYFATPITILSIYFGFFKKKGFKKAIYLITFFGILHYLILKMNS